jgi:hypothetical protein
VDTGCKVEGGSSNKTAAAGDAASQARTPKHANKQSDEIKTETSSPKDGVAKQLTYPQGSSLLRNNNTNSFDGRPNVPGSGSSAFHPPHERHSFPPQHRPPPVQPPMQVSPGGGRYYSNYNNGPPMSQQRYGPRPPPYEHHYQQQQGPPSGFGQQRPPYPPHHGPPSNMYPPGQHYQGFDTAGPSWGPQGYPGNGPPPRYPPPPNYPRSHMQEPPSYSRSSAAAVSRAVSNSFDRSIEKGHHHKHHGSNMNVSPHMGPSMHHSSSNDQASLSGDVSWGQLNQVTSVDEEEMRRRLARNSNRKQQRDDSDDHSQEIALARPHSNSSSLTNSPTEGLEKMEIKQAKLASSLDSLSSVASAQMPMMEDQLKNGKKKESDRKAACTSPSGESEASLDLMKCGSDGSGLLMQRHDTQFSFASATESSSGKRPHDGGDEDREEMETKEEGDGAEIRKAPSGELRPSSKKVRRSTSDGKKTSPLSIQCSPPSSPGAKSKHNPKSTPYSKEPTSATMDSFYAKEPSYTYALETAPSMPNHPDARPGSSTSTLTPMNLENGQEARHPVVGHMPSWEIAPQDSFGAVSTGNGLMSSFSFTQDYPMLAASASHEQGPSGHHSSLPPHHPPPPHHTMHHHQALESRNQSFEGGHYQGGFNRSDSMMSYDGHPYEGRGPGYQGAYPPHAPSWSSAGSYHGYGHAAAQYQNYPPPMMRNYSDDSGRASPPHGPPGVRMMHPHGRQLQPPPDFRAPPSMVNKAGPHRATHILPSPYDGKQSSFGWSKDEDFRLTEIMKKYKNPRDWAPISIELNCGRSAKECHERWIRYLKPGVRKGQWTDHEDAIVIEAVATSSEQPFTRWSDLAQRLPGRVGKQIRDRWVNHLNPNINHLPFARDDDLLLWEGHKKLGKRWVEISTKYFESSRSENHIKNRWYSASFKKFITNEFGPDAYSGGKSVKKESPSKKKKEGRPGSSAASSPTRRQQNELLETFAV